MAFSATVTGDAHNFFAHDFAYGHVDIGFVIQTIYHGYGSFETNSVPVAFTY